jgi:hypothetical protein
MTPVRLILPGAVLALAVAGLGLCGALAGAGASALLSGDLQGAFCEARRGARLDADSKLLTESSAACDEIRQALIDGHITLPQAVDALRAENARRPLPVRTQVGLFQGRTEVEHYAYHALAYVNAVLQGEAPDRREAVLNRLRAELEDMLRPRPS